MLGTWHMALDMSVPGAPARTINGCGVSWSSVQALLRSKETSQSKHEAFHFLMLLGTYDSIAVFLSLVVSVFWQDRLCFKHWTRSCFGKSNYWNIFLGSKRILNSKGQTGLKRPACSGSNAANQWSNRTHMHNGWYHRKMEVLPVALFGTTRCWKHWQQLTVLFFWSFDDYAAMILKVLETWNNFKNNQNLTSQHVWHGYGPKVGYEHLHWSKLLSTITN